MTFTGVAVVINKVSIGMCDCTVDNNVGMDDFSLVQGTLHVCGHAHVPSHVSPSTV